MHINRGRGGKRHKCSFCEQTYTEGKLCDFALGEGKTCDAPMCERCATTVGAQQTDMGFGMTKLNDTVDLCPEHKERGEMGQDWELRSAGDVAEALDWLRRRMKGRGLVLLAISDSAVMVSKEVRVSPQEARRLVEESLRVLQLALERAQARKETRGCGAREERDQ